MEPHPARLLGPCHARLDQQLQCLVFLFASASFRSVPTHDQVQTWNRDRRAITRKHDIAAANIMLAASHTHWGPAVRFRMSFSLGAPNVWYMGFMEDKILTNVEEALKKPVARHNRVRLDRLPRHRLQPAVPQGRRDHLGAIPGRLV